MGDEHLHRLPAIPQPRPRLELLLGPVQGKRVLHVGCVDDTDIERKLRDRQHLHQRVAEVSWAVGVDRNVDGLALLKTHLGGPLVVADADALPFRSGAFDLVLLGEILEHLDSPAGFLRSLRSADAAAELLVTVPNAYSDSLRRSLRHGVEVVNPDHLCTFTPKTLEFLLVRSGWRLIEMTTYTWGTPRNPAKAAAHLLLRRTRRLADLLRDVSAWLAYRRQPFVADGLVALARPSPHLEAPIPLDR